MAKKMGFIHEPAKSENHEWYTPKWVFDDLDLKFDLDPCSPPRGLPWIPVKSFYSKRDNGLQQLWSGRVWLNPPYGRQTGDWLKKMAVHGHGVALVPARTDTTWFHLTARYADAFTLLQGRIDFVNRVGVPQHGFGVGSVFFAWGEECVEAIRRFDMEKRGLFLRNDARKTDP